MHYDLPQLYPSAPEGYPGVHLSHDAFNYRPFGLPTQIRTLHGEALLLSNHADNCLVHNGLSELFDEIEDKLSEMDEKVNSLM